MKHKTLLMTVFVLLLSSVICERQATAQDIYLLIVADTNDERIGQGLGVNVTNLENWFRMYVPARNLAIRKVTGREFSRRGILSAVERINPGGHDGLVVIVCCHGGYNNTGHYLWMHGQRDLYRKDLVRTVKRQGAGTDVVITDACNVSSGPPAGASAPCMPEGGPNRISSLFKSLFLDARGVVDINGASKDQYTFIHRRSGGYFINVFGTALMKNSDREMNWGRFIGVLDDGLNDIYGTRGIKDSTGYVQYKQNVNVWSLPNRGIPGVLSLSRGDVILSVNGQRIGGSNDCIRAVGNSPQRMTFTVRDSRDGTVWRMVTTLQRGRFGISLDDARGGGAYVTRVTSGSAATNNRVLERISAGN